MSVPRTEERHREKADRTRRPVNRPVSGPDRDPRPPEPLVTGRIILRTGPPRALGNRLAPPSRVLKNGCGCRVWLSAAGVRFANGGRESLDRGRVLRGPLKSLGYKWAPESYLSSKYVQLNPRLDARGQVLQQASISVREGNAEAAIAAYRSLVAADRADAEAWLNLGRALHELKRYPEAIAANLEAAKAAPQRGIALFNLACEYALTGEREKAIDAAAKSIEAGYRLKWSYESDSDLAAIREDGRF